MLRLFLGVAIVIFTIVIFSCIFVFPPCHVASMKTDRYVINEPFDKVRKIMVRTNSLQYVVQHQHGQVLNQKWDNLSLSSDRGFSGWSINGTGVFTVSTTSPEIGPQVLNFKQKIYVDHDELQSQTKLTEPAGNLKEMTTWIEMTGDAKTTYVMTTIKIGYQRRLPKNYVPEMQRQVDRSVDVELGKSRSGIEALVTQYADKRFIVPAR